MWVLIAVLAGCLAWAYGAAIGAMAGIVTFAITAGVLGALAWFTSPRIGATPAGLRAGRAVLPWSVIVGAEPVSRQDIARLRGPGADARLFTELRPWSARGGVLVTLRDPADPHPAWLVGYRHPDVLVRQILESMDHPETKELP